VFKKYGISSLIFCVLDSPRRSFAWQKKLHRTTGKKCSTNLQSFQEYPAVSWTADLPAPKRTHLPPGRGLVIWTFHKPFNDRASQ